MYKQTLSCELKAQTGNVRPQIQRREIRTHSWKFVARSLGQAMAGGALGAYLLTMGSALYHYYESANVFLILGFPLYLALGSGVGLVSGSLTLVIEDLIEERLSTKPRIIVTSIIGILLLVGLESFGQPLEWSLVREVILPGTVLGLPAGLLIRSKVPLWRSLVYGAHQTVLVEASDDAADRVLAAFRFVGGLALRLVSVIGILCSTLVLAAWWYFQEMDERLVTIYAIYYFVCTAYISFTVRHRGGILAAGIFLNGLLLLLALYWEPATANGLPEVLLGAYVVLTVLWFLFFAGQRRPKKTEALAASYQEKSARGTSV